MTRDRRLTAAAAGALAYMLAMFLHEALGHGTACVASGGRLIMITPLWMQCTTAEKWMVGAGPFTNFALGLLSLLALQLTKGTARYLLWLLMAFNLLIAAGYMLLGAVAGFGDWAVLFDHCSPSWLWRGLSGIVAATLYYGTMRVAAAKLKGMVSPDRISTLTMAPYLAAGTIGVLASLLNPAGLAQSVLIGAASSFGAGFGLLRLAVLPAWDASTPLPPLTQNRTWITIAAVGALAFILILGRGLGFPH